MLGLYVHVPFCLKKCLYCDFYSVPHSEEFEEVYLGVVAQEIALKGRLFARAADTLYLGGGTPSTLHLGSVESIIALLSKYFPRPADSEATLEVNPGTSSSLDFERLRSLGINRVSIGLQTVSRELLSLLGRPHGLREFYQTVAEVKAAGFNNFSVDAMYALPRQQVSDYLETLKTIVSSGATHVSAYALQVEPGTELFKKVEEGSLALTSEEEILEMMLEGKKFLAGEGFVHYEISNFARPGLQSRHNMLYWQNLDYLGFGPSAASFIGKRRFVNTPDLERYLALLGEGRLPTQSCETLDEKTEMAETVLLGLRMLKEGVSLPAFRERFGCDLLPTYAQQVGDLVRKGLLRVEDEAILLTERAMPVASQVQMAFLP